MKLLKIFIPAVLVLVLVLVLGVILTINLLVSHPGKRLFNDPQFAGSQNQYSCASCHAGGEKIGNIANKKSFLIVDTGYSSIEDVINKAMISTYLSGVPLDKDSQEMKDLVDYLIQLKSD